MFVSTEDPATIQAFQNLTASGWGVQCTTVPHSNHSGAAPCTHNPIEEALLPMVNLDLALDCDSSVGTMGSLWCVLTERLRATARCKAHGEYADVHGTQAGLGSVRRRLKLVALDFVTCPPGLGLWASCSVGLNGR